MDGRIAILIVAVVAASGEHDPKADSHKKTAHTELALACMSKSGRGPVEMEPHQPALETRDLNRCRARLCYEVMMSGMDWCFSASSLASGAWK